MNAPNAATSDVLSHSVWDVRTRLRRCRGTPWLRNQLWCRGR